LIQHRIVTAAPIPLRGQSPFLIRERHAEALAHRFQFLGYLQSENVRIRKIRAVLQRFVSKPENVEIHLVPFEQLVVGEAFEPVAFGAFKAVLGVEGRMRAVFFG
jgi:hypothetical protein